jgi:hypothetical protein
MRLLAALAVAIPVAFVLANTVLRSAPAADRLAGVNVAVAGYTIEPQPSDRHELHLTVRLTSPRDLNECVGFTLDVPFAGRRLTTANGSCARPRAGSSTVELRFQLTRDDLTFPSHTLVWGIPGGRCGIVFELFGVCMVDQAGTTKLELPGPSPLPTIGPIGTLFPFYSFSPAP